MEFSLLTKRMLYYLTLYYLTVGNESFAFKKCLEISMFLARNKTKKFLSFITKLKIYNLSHYFLK